MLTAQAVEGFVTTYLLPGYDQSSPIEWFHREWWQLCCSLDRHIAIAAPRDHSKTATINHGYSVTSAALRKHPYQLKISSTRDIAIEFLQTDKKVFTENEKFQEDFGFKGLVKDTEDDFIAEFHDGYQCRMRAFGAEQRMRGIKWGTKRPSLVLGDDLEDDEQVMNVERRNKLRKWFMRVLLPIGTEETEYRIIGTILHVDSVLAGLMKSENWTHRLYKAHGPNFENILWPRRFSKERLMKIRKRFQEAYDLIGYNMEYLNTATDEESGYFQKQDFVAMGESDHGRNHTFYVGGDLAISTDTRRDRTCFVVGGVDEAGFLDVVEVRRGHWDAKQIVDEMLSIQRTYTPDEWYVEDGTIKKAMGSYLELRMREGDDQGQCYINLAPRTTPSANKASRARPIQGRMRQKSVRFNKDADWYPDYEQEMLNFRGGEERNDQADATAWLGIGLARMIVAPTEKELEWEERRAINKAREQATSMMFAGRSRATGY